MKQRLEIRRPRKAPSGALNAAIGSLPAMPVGCDGGPSSRPAQEPPRRPAFRMDQLCRQAQPPLGRTRRTGTAPRIAAGKRVVCKEAAILDHVAVAFGRRRFDFAIRASLRRPGGCIPIAAKRAAALQQRLPDPGASAGPRRRVPPRTCSSSETKSRRKAARATRCPRHRHREAGGSRPGEIAAMNCAPYAITCAAVMLPPGAAPASIAITLSAGCGGIIAGSPARRPAALRMSSIAGGANRGGRADRPVRCDALKSHDLILRRQDDADSPFLLF